jgi:hypothetical protein
VAYSRRFLNEPKVKLPLSGFARIFRICYKGRQKKQKKQKKAEKDILFPKDNSTSYIPLTDRTESPPPATHYRNTPYDRLYPAGNDSQYYNTGYSEV